MSILAAIGESERSRRIVEIGAELAEKYDEPLYVLHVVPDEDFEEHRQSLDDIPDFDGFTIEQEQESAREFARTYVAETCDPSPAVDVRPIGRVGNLADVVLAEAREHDVRYLVIGGRRRSPVGKAVFGSSTQTILLESDCPVVTTIVE